jgi:mutual gliding-motility protein MglA
MPTLRRRDRTLCFKLVYAGAPLCGKSSNLRHIHAKLAPEGRTELIETLTATDRTLRFEFAVPDAPLMPGYRTIIQICTLPGQIVYNASVQLMLKHADGVVFVADSQLDRQRDNLQAWQTLEATLRLHGSSVERLPTLIQYNKRDLPNVAPLDYLEFLLNNRPKRFPSMEADAAHGRNVMATLNSMAQSVLHNFHQRLLSERVELESADDDAPALAGPTSAPAPLAA